MEKIIDYFNDNNINFLKLGEADFSKKENLLSLTFLYEENNKELIQNNKEKVENLVKKYVSLDLKYSISYKKAFLDEDRLILRIKNFLKTDYIACYYALKDAKVNQQNNNFSIDLYFSLSQNEIDTIITEILNYLTEKYFYNFKIKGHIVNEDFNDLEEHKNKILDNLKGPVKINKMKVNKIENIIGEIKELSCYPYECYTSSEEDIVLCGNLIKIEPVEFLKKDGEHHGLRYALTIKCLDKFFKASLFPTKKTEEICKTIESGIDVIMQGSLDMFNHELSMKVKNIAKCVIEDYVKPQYEINKEFNDYLVVRPLKYEEISQINLFDKVIEKDYLNNNVFVAFDFETTGLEYMVDKVTEIGAVKIKNGKIIETFQTLINPQKHISKEITLKTGISNEMVKNSPLFEDMIPDFYKFSKDTILIGQNISFDFGFLDFYGRKANYIFDNKKEDTLTIARKFLFMKSYKLEKIAETLNVGSFVAHRALNDALATAKIFIKLVEKFY